MVSWLNVQISGASKTNRNTENVESVDVKATGAEDGTSFTLNGTLATMAMQMVMTVPANAMVAEGANPFAAGLDLDGAYSFGAGTFTFNATEDGAATDGTMTMTGGTVAFAMDHAAMDYSFGLQGLTTAMTSAELPFPGRYRVYAFAPVTAAAAPAWLPGGLDHAAAGVHEVPASPGQWAWLGEVQVGADRRAAVTLAAGGPGLCVDAVRFEQVQAAPGSGR